MAVSVGIAAAAATALAVPGAAAEETRTAEPGDDRRAVVAHLSQEYGLGADEAADVLAEQHRSFLVARGLSDRLGSRVVGTAVTERSGELQVEVTDVEAAAVVTAAGARPVVVDRDPVRRAARLVRETAEDLDGSGAAVFADGGEIVVQLPPEVPAGEVRRATDRVTDEGLPVRVERLPGPASTTALVGGEKLYRDGSYCTGGFNLDGGASVYHLTAGHCTGGSWSDDAGTVGISVASEFPGEDWRLLGVLDSVAAYGDVRFLDGGTVNILTSGRPPVGTTVCATGASSGTRCGSILAYDVSVSYASGTVNGLVAAEICRIGGDSGGPLYTTGGTAVGVLSGSTSGDCEGYEWSYYEDVQQIVDEFGMPVL